MHPLLNNLSICRVLPGPLIHAFTLFASLYPRCREKVLIFCVLFTGAVQTVWIAHLLPMTHLWFAVVWQRQQCCQHYYIFPLVFAAHFLVQASKNTCLSILQYIIVYIPLTKTLPGFKEYTCMTRKARRELKSSSPNRKTGEAFILCPCLLTFESCKTWGRCLEEAQIAVWMIQ